MVYSFKGHVSECRLTIAIDELIFLLSLLFSCVYYIHDVRMGIGLKSGAELTFPGHERKFTCCSLDANLLYLICFLSELLV